MLLRMVCTHPGGKAPQALGSEHKLCDVGRPRVAPLNAENGYELAADPVASVLDSEAPAAGTCPVPPSGGFGSPADVLFGT
jgi:hypothetical protein